MTTYTHGHAEPVLASHRWRTAENSCAYLLPHLRPGQDLLDLGCGPGTITVDLAERVAPGRVVGLDAAAGVLEEASALAERRGAAVEWVTGDALALPFADASFDVVHAHQVLQHVADPVGVLREMARVLRPGGVLAVRDVDYAATTWYPAESGLDAWLDLYGRVARSNGGEPDAGRRLLAWAREAGLRQDDGSAVATVTASASAWCYASPDEREWWGTSWAGRATASAFAEQAVARGEASAEQLEEIAAAWRRWAASPDGWIALLHGELLVQLR
ncbi:Methyltransferase domain-containing protein [Quadrisphaera granulorum]|uniref:Methyltransferase family protein n=1 Tax=Quadrisphaera granulorum TaxID=317664 RepID=A0A316A7L1_9ACTN|nr:methyltransferase domain-containing protein [Quadrisphaera granulorum]PWJ53705.1 methyltransferase family protein [Quadrisphaera granulorum]SZE96749.1 Methyltransferase domain-containing protein [Quadrisphaera granulorum]